ncbi:MAG: hypothetical protein K2X82_26085 [Gemmataceae bacterium]|nr:hypothetical protein [Gemmataceae bacterium]
MSEDRTDARDAPDAPPTGTNGHPGANGPAAPPDRRAELAKLRAKVADLRRWCREFLDDPAAAGVLPADVVADLRAVEPAVSQNEANALYLAVAKGEPVAATHPAFRPGPGEPARPDDAVAALTAERERLRQAFFAVYDAVFPDDVPTEAEILWGVQHPCGQSISEILDEIERELGLESGGRP